MFAYRTGQGPHPRTAPKASTRLRRLAAAMAAVIVGLLASVAIPAAFARDIPVPGAYFGTISVARVPSATVHAAAAVGRAGWQVTLIAVGAALAAAAVTILLRRVRAVPSSAA